MRLTAATGQCDHGGTYEPYGPQVNLGGLSRFATASCDFHNDNRYRYVRAVVWRKITNHWRTTTRPARIAPVKAATVMSNNDYYVITSKRGEHPDGWSWEIRRRSKPLGVKLMAHGFQSNAAAQVAGKRALAEFLSALSKEERRRT
jgi:hypothetical protein